jgi:hemolysin activation/secretion protein
LYRSIFLKKLEKEREKVFFKMRTLLAVGSLLSATSLQAEIIPDAGSILRQQQYQLQPPNQFPASEKEKVPTPPDNNGIRVTVRSFTFSGYEGLATEMELQSIVAGSVGKNLSYNELQAQADKVSAYLRQKGWFLAHAYLPKQDVTAGTIEIGITQGKSDGSISIKADKTVRINQSILRGMGKSATHIGQPINKQHLERAVLLINDLPGITARSFVAPGTKTGSSNVEITVSEGSLLKGAVWGDNYGNRYTGSWRGNAMLSVNDPFHLGDKMSLMITKSEGLTLGRIDYSFPIASNGMKGTLSYTGMRYKLIGDLASLEYKGHSNSIDAGLSYPLRRSRTSNITTAITYGYQALIDNRFSVDIHDRKLNTVTFRGKGDSYDTMLGGGYNNWNISATTGDFHESIADISSAKTEGQFTRFNFGLSRLQRLAKRATLDVSWSGQVALNNLDSSEELSLGGPNGVRSYPVGEASGDEGHIINTELRYNLPVPAAWGNVQLCGFYDAGHITIKKEETAISLGTATNLNSYWLQGVGAGLNYTSSPGNFALRLSWAHVIGENSGRSVKGKNSDGQKNDDRFWLESRIYF